MFLLSRHFAAMPSTRAPPKPWRANSDAAVLRILSRVRTGSRLRLAMAASGARAAGRGRRGRRARGFAGITDELPDARRRQRQIERLHIEMLQRVRHRIGDDSADRDDAALAGPLGAERI